MDRTTTIENTTLTKELLAPRITIDWDYASNTGPINFHVEEVLFVDGVELQKRPKFVLTSSIEELVGRMFDVTMPDGTQMEIPGVLAMAVFKRAFEVLIAAKEM